MNKSLLLINKFSRIYLSMFVEYYWMSVGLVMKII